MPRPLPLFLLALAAPSLAFALGTRAEFDIVDSNDDGYVSSGEYEVYTHNIFDEMDTEGSDDKLSPDEVHANEKRFNTYIFTTGNLLGPADLSTAQKVQRLDANQDGAVSQTEYLDATAAKFRAMDGNHDGTLTPAEFDGG